MLRDPPQVRWRFAYLTAIALLVAACAQHAPPPIVGPKPGTHGARDHCEVIVTACTEVSRWERRPGCWVIHYDAEVRGRDADLVCRVAGSIWDQCARSAPGVASLTRVDGTQIPLAPTWECYAAPRLADDHRTRLRRDPCAAATRAHHWQWRVPTSFCLICQEDPQGVTCLALNGEALMDAIDPRGRLGAVTLESSPATFTVPAVTPSESGGRSVSGAGIGGVFP